MIQVPFYPNSGDIHCFKSSFRLVLKCFFPSNDYSLNETNTLTDKKTGMSICPIRMLLRLVDLGLDSAMMKSFDAYAFVKRGEKYLKRELGKHTADWQVKNSDVPYEQKIYKKYLDNLGYTQNIPGVNYISSYLNIAA